MNLLKKTTLIMSFMGLMLLTSLILSPRANAIATSSAIVYPFSYCQEPHTYYDIYAPGGNFSVTEGTSGHTITVYGKVHVCSNVQYEWALWPHISFFNINSRITGLAGDMNFGQQTFLGLAAQRGNIYTVSRNITINTSGLRQGTHNLCFNWQGRAYYGFWDFTPVQEGCFVVTVNASSNITGVISIIKYGPNDSYWIPTSNSDPSFPGKLGICLYGVFAIQIGCLNNGVKDYEKDLTVSANVNHTARTEPLIPDDGWYVEKIRINPGNHIISNPAYNSSPGVSVGSGQQKFIDYFFEKYAAECRNTITNPQKPKVGETFTATFTKRNPGGITDWHSVDGVKMFLRIPPQFEFVSGTGVSDAPENALEAALGFDNKYINLISTVNSGSDLSRTLTFRVKSNVEANKAYDFITTMVFPQDAPAANPFGSPYNPSCTSSIQIAPAEFNPWLQTQNGDVVASGAIIGQQPGSLGSRAINNPDKEVEYLIISAIGGSGPFCSTNNYILTNLSALSGNCANGTGYSLHAPQLGKDKVIEAISKAWNENGSGDASVGNKCSPYNTLIFSDLSNQTKNTANCLNGTIYKLNSSSLGNFTLEGGRTTIWVSGDLTINGDIQYAYSNYNDPRKVPNLAIIVDGNVNIDANITQIDAAIYSTKKIITCAQFNANNNQSAVTCNKPLIVHGMMVGKSGFGFYRTHTSNSTNPPPAELVILTGQTVAFPPPGFDNRYFEDFDSSVKVDFGEFQPRF